VKRARSFIKRIGTRPFSGTRFVEAKLVLIEWWPGGKRKIITIGPNTKKNRDYADEVLEVALTKARTTRDGVGPAKEDISLGDLLSRYLEDAKVRRNPRSGRPLSERTLELYSEHDKTLRLHFSSALGRPARQLRRPDVRGFITSKTKGGWEAKSIALVVDYLKAAYAWALAEVELIDANPIAGAKAPSRKGHAEAYTADETALLFEGLSSLPARSWRFRTLGILEALYGARANQIINLEWTDVDLHVPCSLRLASGEELSLTGTITLRQEVRGSKGQATRVVPMLPPARRVLLEAWGRRHPDSPFVIWGRHDAMKPVRYDSMNTALKKHEDRVGVEHHPNRSFHAFRRAVATKLGEVLGPKFAAEWIGDTLQATILHYVKETATTQAAAAQALLKTYGDAGSPTEPLPNRESAAVAEKTEAASA